MFGDVYRNKIAHVAQLAEHSTRNARVTGSIPVVGYEFVSTCHRVTETQRRKERVMSLNLNLYQKKISIFIWIVGIVFLILFLILSYIQLLKGEELRARAKEMHTTIKVVQCPRGTIYDCHGNVLAISLKVNSSFVHPAQIKTDPILLSKKIAPILGMTEKTILHKLKSNESFVWLKRKMSETQSKKLESIQGIHFLKEYKRYYPSGNLAAHILGFVGIDGNGLEGEEFAFEKELAVPPISINCLKDGKGELIFVTSKDCQNIDSAGNNLTLTIDNVIQHYSEEELTAACQKNKATGGSIIVMNPTTGEILACAVYPSYNLNYFQKYTPYQRRNKAITDTFEPGSILKLVAAAYLLEKGLVKPTNTFFCPGYVDVTPHKKMYCATHKHGVVDFAQIIENSCNVGMIKASKNLVPKDFYEYLQRFGFGCQTGVNFPGETSGIILNPAQWSKITAPNLVMGQGIAVSSLQLINSVAAIANGGILMKPLLVKTITDANGKIIYAYQPTQIRRVVTSEIAEFLTETMQKVVLQGTGMLAGIEGYDICGKTGTAQKIPYKNKKYISSFVGFIPAHSPKIICLVVIDEPKEGYYGGYIAAPIFKNLIQKILTYLEIPPSMGNYKVGTQ